MIASIGPEGNGIVTLDGSGNGTASVGPLSAREVWTPQNAHVSVSSNVNEATCTIYVGSSPTQQYFRDATFTGSTGDSSDRINADTVKVGTKVWAVWEDGDAGAQGIIQVTGTKTI